MGVFVLHSTTRSGAAVPSASQTAQPVCVCLRAVKIDRCDARGHHHLQPDRGLTGLLAQGRQTPQPMLTEHQRILAGGLDGVDARATVSSGLANNPLAQLGAGSANVPQNLAQLHQHLAGLGGGQHPLGVHLPSQNPSGASALPNAGAGGLPIPPAGVQLGPAGGLPGHAQQGFAQQQQAQQLLPGMGNIGLNQLMNLQGRQAPGQGLTPQQQLMLQQQHAQNAAAGAPPGHRGL